MLRLVVVATLVSTGLAVGAAQPATSPTGRLAGETQISYGCPGPLREGGPTCDPWRPFEHARFSVARRAANGLATPGTNRVLVSDATAHFAVRLAPGRYLVTPLPQPTTRGGPTLTVRVPAGGTTTILVRFLGFPQME